MLSAAPWAPGAVLLPRPCGDPSPTGDSHGCFTVVPVGSASVASAVDPVSSTSGVPGTPGLWPPNPPASCGPFAPLFMAVALSGHFGRGRSKGIQTRE